MFGAGPTSRRARGAPAFTLVELLIVVSIIALLVSLLLPSLKKAREQTRRTVCAARLKSLGTSWEIYAIEYDSPPRLARRGVDVNYDCPNVNACVRKSYGGFGPEYFDDYLSGNSDGQVWISAVWYRHVLFQVENPPPPGPLPGDWWNWGLIWKSGVVQDPRVFFCPSVRDPDFAWNTPLNPWPPSVETMWRPDYPHMVNHTQASYERRIALTGAQWDRIPGQVTIAHDLAAPNVAAMAHHTGSNVSYRDGHVTFVIGDRFITWGDGEKYDYRKTATRRKLLEYSYWMDTEGLYAFDSGRTRQP